MREWGTFENSRASVVEKSIEFAGRIWKPTRKLAYVKAALCHSLPPANSKGRVFTAATLANSAHTAVMQMMDIEHMLEFYGDAQDRIGGAIAAVEFPAKEDAIALEAAGKAVPLTILFALWRKAAGVERLLDDIAHEAANEQVPHPWRTSMECEWPGELSALYDGAKFYSWDECSDEMKALVKVDRVDDYGGKPMRLVMGGRDGLVYFTGGGLTRTPSDTRATIESVAASDGHAAPNPARMLVTLGWDEWKQQVASEKQETGARAWNTQDAPDRYFAYVPAEARGADGKKSLRKLPLASVEKKGLDPAILRNALARFPQTDLPAGAKAGVKRKILSAIRTWNAAHPSDKIEAASEAGERAVIGQTEEAAGHTHPVTEDMAVGAAQGHTHSLLVTGYELGALEAVTSSHSDGQSEHQHWIQLSGTTATASTPDQPAASQGGGAAPEGSKKEEAMDRKGLAGLLREQAKAFAGKDDAHAKFLGDAASLLDKEESAAAVEDVIAVRIKAGALIPKGDHEKAVADATAAAKAAGVKEVEDRLAAEKRQAEVIASRMKAVTDAGLDAAFPLRKDVTIASVATAIATDEAGEKAFGERLEEWKALRASGQATAQATASDKTTVVTPPMKVADGKAARPSHLYC